MPVSLTRHLKHCAGEWHSFRVVLRTFENYGRCQMILIGYVFRQIYLLLCHKLILSACNVDDGVNLWREVRNSAERRHETSADADVTCCVFRFLVCNIQNLENKVEHRWVTSLGIRLKDWKRLRLAASQIGLSRINYFIDPSPSEFLASYRRLNCASHRVVEIFIPARERAINNFAPPLKPDSGGGCVVVGLVLHYPTNEMRRLKASDTNRT